MVSGFGNPRDASAGFTLLELLIVLTIVGLLVSLVPSLISAVIPGTKLQVASRQFATTLRDARNEAVSIGRETAVTISVEPPQYVVGNKAPRNFPDGIRVFLQGSADGGTNLGQSDLLSRQDDRHKIRFYPDGSSSGAVIMLRQDRMSYTVEVEWLLGRVALSRSSADAR